MRYKPTFEKNLSTALTVHYSQNGKEVHHHLSYLFSRFVFGKSKSDGSHASTCTVRTVPYKRAGDGREPDGSDRGPDIVLLI
jgi:hypothetical protein